MLVSNVSKTKLLDLSADLLIVCSRSDKNNPGQTLFPVELPAIELKLGLQLKQEAAARQFAGILGDEFIIPLFNDSSFKTIALLGISDDCEPADLQMKIGAACQQLAAKLKAGTVLILLDEHKSANEEFSIQLIFEGAILASYAFDKYKSIVAEVPVKEMTFASLLDENKSEVIIKTAQIRAQAAMTARDFINEPACAINPQTLAIRAQDLGAQHGFAVEVYDEQFLKKERLNLLLAVGAAMEDVAPPRLIKLSYASTPDALHVCLVGKGVTFDSGGLDMKPPAGMLTMKYDMSGAASVLGTMIAIAQLKPKIRVTAYLSCAENGVSAKAYHPGDVITSRAGISVEITNTDAEGRLVLADAITYAQEIDKPDILINLATLTGAAKAALGNHAAAIFSNDDTLCEQLTAEGTNNAESLWRLPLDKRLQVQLKSYIADIKNSGGSFGGAITAALFIQKFITAPTKWAHLDIAGPAFTDKNSYYLREGATGFGVRTLVAFLMARG